MTSVSSQGFSSSDSCCRRRCVPGDVCGQDVRGCWRVEDCQIGSNIGNSEEGNLQLNIKEKAKKKIVNDKKLDGVGPVDNRPSTD